MERTDNSLIAKDFKKSDNLPSIVSLTFRPYFGMPMNFRFLFLLTFFLLQAISFAEAGEMAKLTLIKGPDLGGHGSIMEDCNGRLTLKENNNADDLRRSLAEYFCEGEYSIVLDGPAGKIVTLFGSFQFKKERGFLIIRKKDSKGIWVEELQAYPERKWHSVPAEGMYGSFDVFYVPAPRFRTRISSIKWGKWWEGPLPNIN